MRRSTGVGPPSLDYQPRRPADDVVYRTVRDHFETFRAYAAAFRDGAGLSRFVEAEFRAFLRCGMAERAAHLVDRVLPDVPVRQWVLTVPFRLRYRLAWDHALCRAVGAAGR